MSKVYMNSLLKIKIKFFVICKNNNFFLRRNSKHVNLKNYFVLDLKICCESSSEYLSLIPKESGLILEPKQNTSPRSSRCLNGPTLIAGAGAYLCDTENPEKSCPISYFCSNHSTLGNSICCAAYSQTKSTLITQQLLQYLNFNEISITNNVCSENR